MVRDGELVVIDVAFVQVRPSPWRQAVDLANMMLVLAVRTDPDRVYERALRYFTRGRDRRGVRRDAGHRQPDPAPLRARRATVATCWPGSGPSLPTRRPISLQRWTFRRIALALALLLGAAVRGPADLADLLARHTTSACTSPPTAAPTTR